MGAVALITGSTVGAGMLALPAVSAPAGIVPTSTGLVAIWALLTLDALLIAEVNLAALAARDSRLGSDNQSTAAGAPAEGGIVTLRQMAEFSLGKAGKALTLVYLALAYSLLTAYCTKAAEVLDYFAGGGLPPLVGSGLFCGAVGAFLYKEGTRTIDSLNQGLTSVLLALFAFILTAGASQSALPAALAAGPAGLAALRPCDWGALEPAVPIMFLALVYHDLVPVIVSYLGGDRRAIRSAIVLGSLVPLSMFLSWEAVALSLLPAGLADPADSAALLQASLQLGAEGGGALSAAPAVLGPADALLGGMQAVGSMHSGAAAASLNAGVLADASVVGVPRAIDPLQIFVRRAGPVVGSVVEGFSFLAVMTSFIGTTLSMSETLRHEVPPLLGEAGKLLQRFAGADISPEASDDELACLAGTGPCSGTSGTTAGDAAAGQEATEGLAGLGSDERALALLLTLCPPLALAASNPDSFLGALEIAGGYFMTLLYGVLPPLMAWKLREKLHGRAGHTRPHRQGHTAKAGHATAGDRAPPPAAAQRLPPPQQPTQLAVEAAEHTVQAPQKALWRQQHEEMVPGGLPMLAGMFSAACLIEVSRLAADAGLTGGPGNEALQGAIEAALHSPAAASEAMMALLQAAPL
ncbi:hypothetical protein ABPG77_001148 [Micractinium sp. CCAP 211/92]